MKERLFVILLLLFFSSPLWAQVDASINGLVLSPQGQFKENIDRAGFGVSGSGAYRFSGTPFSAGFNIGWAQYGSETSRQTLLFPVQVDVTTSNNIFSMHLFGRIEEDFGLFVPYAEGLVGFSYLSTDSEIEDIGSNNNDDEIASDTQLEDWTSNYGVGGGVMIRLTDFENEHNAYFGNTILYLDLKVRYMFGGEADYLKEGDISQGPNDEILFDASHSETDFITFHIGVVFHLF